MAAANELAVEAIQLETFVDKIEQLQQHFGSLQSVMEKRAKKKTISNMTNRGGVQRSPFWVPVRVQGGAPIQQFAADTSGSIPAWGRGSGSKMVSFCASPVRLVNVCEVSNLAQQATEGNDQGIVKFRREEMTSSLKAFENGVEAVLNRDGSGTIDTIPSTAIVHNADGPAGQSYSSIVGLNTAASFVDQQVVQVLSGIGGTNRGTFTVSYVDPASQTIYSAEALPTGTTNGDILVIQGATGAAGSSIYGKDYWIQNGNVGTKAGVDISQYPGRFSSPTINFGGSGTVVQSTAQRVAAIRMRAIGDGDYNANEDAFWYLNPVQAVAQSDLYYNPGITRLDQGGDRVPDTAKSHFSKTFLGEEAVWSSTAEQTRADRIVPGSWTFGEMFPTRLHEWTPGNPIVPVPTNDGSGNTTYYDSTMFAYERALNLICGDMKRQFFLQGLPIPADS